MKPEWDGELVLKRLLKPQEKYSIMLNSKDFFYNLKASSKALK